jgi:hypothetical protein
MMGEVLTRCGYRCDLCLAYRANIETNPSSLQIVSDGWQKYFGFRVRPEQMLCDGCMAENGLLVDTGCPVRPCVIEKGLENCAHCAEDGCEKLKQRTVVCEEVAARIGGSIPDADRAGFIAPHENKVRLDRIREPAG